MHLLSEDGDDEPSPNGSFRKIVAVPWPCLPVTIRSTSVPVMNSSVSLSPARACAKQCHTCLSSSVCLSSDSRGSKDSECPWQTTRMFAWGASLGGAMLGSAHRLNASEEAATKNSFLGPWPSPPSTRRPCTCFVPLEDSKYGSRRHVRFNGSNCSETSNSTCSRLTTTSAGGTPSGIIRNLKNTALALHESRLRRASIRGSPQASSNSCQSNRLDEDWLTSASNAWRNNKTSLSYSGTAKRSSFSSNPKDALLAAASTTETATNSAWLSSVSSLSAGLQTLAMCSKIDASAAFSASCLATSTSAADVCAHMVWEMTRRINTTRPARGLAGAVAIHVSSQLLTSPGSALHKACVTPETFFSLSPTAFPASCTTGWSCACRSSSSSSFAGATRPLLKQRLPMLISGHTRTLCACKPALAYWNGLPRSTGRA
mmetsp:Transcript_109124/g.216674  ORF Transcript_109124/g.216674 Transcript_109124/m.216674 type:complete len:430 (-) Transcript_109124:20-1309(-)